MDKTPARDFKLTLWILAGIGLAYWILFAFPNATGAKDEHMLFLFSNDETITYPVVVHMLAPVARPTALWGQLIIYGDYHYGYPFYFLSMLAVLPVRLIFGSAYTQHTQLNLFLLRQMISVLPMILAAGVLVYLQTRFRSWLRSAILFGLILAIPGVVRNNLHWWHPDALAVLAVVLTLFFLDRDRFRLGRNFTAAALMCGLAISIKLIGFFFGLAIAAYLLAAWWKWKQPWRKTVLQGLIFIAIMSLTVVVTNPFLLYPGQRAKLVRIQAEKQVELSTGYTHDDPRNYQKNPNGWALTLEAWYGSPWFLAFLAGSLIAGGLAGRARLANSLILAWVLPYSVYLLWFVAVKPDHYWLPVMLPLVSGALNWLDLSVGQVTTRGVETIPASLAVAQGTRSETRPTRHWVQITLAALLAAVLGAQLIRYVPKEVRIYNEALTQETRYGY